MIVTGAFLAEAAATVDNKLNVQGGVLSRYTVGPDRAARFVLVVLTQAEAEASDGDRRLDVEIMPPKLDEVPQYRRFEVPEVAIGMFPGFAFFAIEVTLPFDGRWVIVVTCGSGAISLPLLVDGWVPPPSLGI
ncbi:hypothetical protein [Mycobacterium haemophilum]|uniref:YtkA-like domain-containing protein n=1 Tax=Mycobacterium haemophilum TaxID=29311 RepID=A0A0I9UJG9_9MYCO|nr:hypothetical protein [Mycobacterium haemophilum]AKN15816.1 hypothetical protein B586_03360 [Mycobacterium haemophilum DSM 44634]KLO31257.1 hypothetical protein ABH39_09450 [Mycobacterium haemophilum]KLO36179.1 hypothetical protein ABH38_13370 [Mycobacterium haemophilum]KLO42068.1 hypothetical protein ABH37_12000 [Mycobacterium haemophilum]KLO49978.1 hypothetical protein ABH36_09920 [Mycobacterium haemophilum]